MSLQNLIHYADYMDGKGHNIVANAVDLAYQESDGKYDKALTNLAVFALWLESDGFAEQADQIDTFLRLTVPSMEKKAELPGASSLYDTDAHREESLFGALIDEAKKEPEVDLETLKGGAHPLLTRYSPDYPGVMMQRISDGVYQDLLSKKVYDFKSGFISDTGTRYYGGSVSFQTPTAQNYLNSPQIMDSKHLRTRPR